MQCKWNIQCSNAVSSTFQLHKRFIIYVLDLESVQSPVSSISAHHVSLIRSFFEENCFQNLSISEFSQAPSDDYVIHDKLSVVLVLLQNNFRLV